MTREITSKDKPLKTSYYFRVIINKNYSSALLTVYNTKLWQGYQYRDLMVNVQSVTYTSDHHHLTCTIWSAIIHRLQVLLYQHSVKFFSLTIFRYNLMTSFKCILKKLKWPPIRLEASIVGMKIHTVFGMEIPLYSYKSVSMEMTQIKWGAEYRAEYNPRYARNRRLNM